MPYSWPGRSRWPVRKRCPVVFHIRDDVFTQISEKPTVMVPSYPSPADRTLALRLIQMLWDCGEGAGYAQHLSWDPYAETPEHRVLLPTVFGDHQVTPLAAVIEARTIGAYAVVPALADGRGWEQDPFWGVPVIDSFPFGGTAVVMWDSGAEVPPEATHRHAKAKTPTVIRDDIGDYAPKEASVWSLAFVPEGTEIPKPDAVRNLADPLAAEQNRLPPTQQTPSTGPATVPGTPTTVVAEPDTTTSVP